MKSGGIILCGGKSVRMGVDKAMLPFGPETMLQRMVRLVGGVVGLENVVVVASQGQNLPELSEQLTIARDGHENRGPLEALRCGFLAREDLECAFVSGCDTPLLVPAWIERLLALANEGDLADCDIAVTKQGENFHPLSALYHQRVLSVIEQRLAAGQFSLHGLFDQCNMLEIDVRLLREVDPELRSLENVNEVSEYERALRLASFLSSKSES